MTPPSAPSPLLHPLAELYAREGRPLPVLEPVAPETMPEPARQLLVHQRDMTRTLESFHQGRLHLRLLRQQREDAHYFRLVALELDGTSQPVEFGATKVYLGHLPARARDLILEGRRPLGGILNDQGVPYRSAPSAFFVTAGDDLIREALGLAAGTAPLRLYGRRNTLSSPEGEPLAEIIEILPPMPPPTRALPA